MLLEDRQWLSLWRKWLVKMSVGIWGAGNILIPDLDASYILEFNMWTAAKLHADDLDTFLYLYYTLIKCF